MGCVPFHMGLCLWEVPTVNPSVTPPACQLPLAREPFCLRYRYRAERGAKTAAPCIDSGSTPPPSGIGGLSAELITYSFFPIP